MNNSTRIIQNSIVLYGRLIITTLLKLVITKLLVKYLGLEGYGLYNLLAGVVMMLAFFKATLASTSQRFLSVSLGRDNIEGTREIYYLLYVLHTVMAIAILLLIDVLGVILVHYVLNIPSGLETTANMLIHTMAISTAITILSVPNDALLISKENLLALSLILVLECVLNFFAAYSLQWIDGENRLNIYAIMMALVIFISFVIRQIYIKRYGESHVHIHRITDFSIIKEMSKYTGWSTICSLFYLIRNQGYAILFNIVGGVLVNSAYGIANQVNSLVSYATEALMQPIRPQIMKTESSGNREKSIAMMLFSAKAINCLLIFVTIPVLIYIETILELWIKDVPDYAPFFCRIIILSSLVFSFSNSIKAIVEATGNVKELFSVIGYLHLATIAISVIIALLTRNLTMAFSCIVLEEIFASYYRIRLGGKYVSINVSKYLKEVVLKESTIFATTFSSLYFVNVYVESIPYILFLSFVLLFFNMFLFYTWIFNEEEKKHIKKMCSFIN